MGIFNEFYKKEKPFFTGIARGFGFGGGGGGRICFSFSWNFVGIWWEPNIHQVIINFMFSDLTTLQRIFCK